MIKARSNSDPLSPSGGIQQDTPAHNPIDRTYSLISKLNESKALNQRSKNFPKGGSQNIWKYVSEGILNLREEDFALKDNVERIVESASAPISPLISPEKNMKSIIKEYKYKMKYLREHTRLKQQYQFMKKTRLMERGISPTSALAPPKKNSDSHKRTLIVDLDKTLILSYPDPETRAHVEEHNPELLRETADGVVFILRPHALEFLVTLKEYYEICIFTTGERDYAAPILSAIQGSDFHLFAHVFYRYDCYLSLGLPFKRLLQGRELKDTIIVDDTILCWVHALKNLVPLTPFMGSVDDRVLELLTAYLLDIATFPDLPALNSQVFVMDDAN